MQFDFGVMWGADHFEIQSELLCYGNKERACQHCHTFSRRESTRRSGSVFHTQYRWTCPRVVITAANGDSNGVCLDCIILAALSYGADTQPV